MLAAVALLLFASPQPFESVLHSGLEALRHNELQTAQAQLERAAKLDPSSAQAWLGLAQTRWKLHRTDDANRAALRAEALAAGDPAILEGLLYYYAETRSDSKVIEIGNRLVAREDRADVRALLARTYASAGQPENAVAEWRAAVRLRPYDEVGYFEWAQILLNQQKFAESLDVLEAGINLFDKSAQLELARGVALYGLRRFPEAIDSFLRTIRLAPDVPQPYLFLGRMLEQAETKLPEIVRAFAKLHQTEPDNFMAGLLYAKGLIAQEGDSPEAESLLRESIRQKGEYWESHFELGLLLERRHRFADAAAELETAVRLNPNAAVPHYRLARVYDRLGKTAQANEQRALHEKLSAEQKGAGMQASRPMIK